MLRADNKLPNNSSIGVQNRLLCSLPDYFTIEVLDIVHFKVGAALAATFTTKMHFVSHTSYSNIET